MWSYAKKLPYREEDDGDYDGFADEYDVLDPVSFSGCNLQAVVKIADYTFTPGAEFEGVWHYEGVYCHCALSLFNPCIFLLDNGLTHRLCTIGMAHEDIVMTGLFYPHSDENLGGGLEFKRTFTDVEAKQIFYGVPQNRVDWLNKYIEDGFVPLGKTTTETGKFLVFPNSHAHRVMKMKNRSAVTVTRRLVVFFVINPESRIPSSRDHPPMPRQISLDIAVTNRLELMHERKFAKEKLNPRVIELCEH